MRVALIHYGEIALKGGNRDFFERVLIENIKKSLGTKNISVKKLYGRILVEFKEEVDFNEIENKLKKVFGIANFSFCESFLARLYCSASGAEQTKIMDEIKNAVWEFLKDKKFSSFAIKTSRADKSFPFTSQQINKIVGGFIKEKSGAKVNLENPDLTCFIEITSPSFLPLRRRGRGERGWQIFIYDKKIKGAGGLPVGVSGKLISLLSSGFDSPVAAYLMMKRGAQIVFVHFHSYPETSLASRENVEELVKILNEYQFKSRIYFINILKLQKQIMLKTPERFRVIFYRRAMVRIANEIAKKEDALGLVTGDSVGQVASQTLENLNTVTRASELSIHRPLAGFDKEEIINLSKKLGLYEISSRGYDDCCSLFTPIHPATKSEPEMIGKIEKGLKLEKLLGEAIKKAEIVEL